MVMTSGVEKKILAIFNTRSATNWGPSPFTQKGKFPRFFFFSVGCRDLLQPAGRSGGSTFSRAADCGGVATSPSHVATPRRKRTRRGGKLFFFSFWRYVVCVSSPPPPEGRHSSSSPLLPRWLLTGDDDDDHCTHSTHCTHSRTTGVGLCVSLCQRPQSWAGSSGWPT